jgi:hypothetical protein
MKTTLPHKTQHKDRGKVVEMVVITVVVVSTPADTAIL